MKRAICILAALGTSWWLFADTVAYHRGQSRAEDTLRFAHYGGFGDYELWQEVIRAFEDAHRGAAVVQEYIPGYGTEYDNKLRRQLLADVAPDVFMVQDESFPQYAADSLANLEAVLGTEVLAKLHADLHATATGSFTHHDAPHALPLYGGNLLIYLNLRCLERVTDTSELPEFVGDDWTLDEFLHLCRLLTRDFDGDGRVDQYGLWHPWWGYYLPILWSMGAEILDESRTEWRLEGSAARAAVQLYRDLLLKDKVCPGPGEFGQMRQDIAFLTGKVAMVINGPWFIPLLEETDLRDDYIVLHVPRGPAGRFTRVTWDGIGVNQHISAARQRLAAAFALFTVSGAAQDIFASSKRVIPARTESRSAFGHERMRNGLDKFVTSFDYVRVQPITRHWKGMNRALQRHLARLLSDELTTAEFLDQLKGDRDIWAHFVVP